MNCFGSKKILTINSGSSSVKFALFQMGQSEEIQFSGQARRIGHSGAEFQVKLSNDATATRQSIDIPDHEAAFRIIFNWLGTRDEARNLDAVGHRIVHGGITNTVPKPIDLNLTASLGQLISLAPEHLPNEIKAIEAVSSEFPSLFQVACFDTSFHRQMPRPAQMYALPRNLADQGIIRYGFHGLSYEYIVGELHHKFPRAVDDRLIIAHLGNGSSMAAVRRGIGVDTTMGFTPAGGLVMSTRTGDLDPGVMLHLLAPLGMNAADLNDLINKRSGLLGVSGVSSDMKDLLDIENVNSNAAEAVELFCYQARKQLASLAAVLGGLDRLVFTAGIGEHAPTIRWRICQQLAFLGVYLDHSRNNRNDLIVSADNSPVTVCVMPTNEELMIARHTAKLLHNS